VFSARQTSCLFPFAVTAAQELCAFGVQGDAVESDCTIGILLRVLCKARVEAFHVFKPSLVLFEVIGFAPFVTVRVDPLL
jgi:hypothetical protein